MKKIVIAAGGTGGHVIPAMILGDELEKEPRFSVEYIGVGLGKNAYFRKEGHRFLEITGGNFSNGFIKGALRIMKGFLTARARLKEEQVSRVIGFGSYHSLPVVLAAWTLGIPFDIVELNTFPGKINRFFSKWAETTFIHFDPTKKQLKGKSVLIDYSLKENPSSITKEEGLNYFGLEKGKKVVFVFGGSQGALAISNAWLKASAAFTEKFQVIHITTEVDKAISIYKERGMKAFVAPFIDKMDFAYTIADLAICRSGAGALREMMVYGCPAILIPFPKAAEGHQEFNAIYMQEKIGGAVCLKEGEDLADQLQQTLNFLLANNEKKLSDMRNSLFRAKRSEERENLTTLIRRKYE